MKNILNGKKWTCPLIFQVKGTVILHIWWQVILMQVYTIVIVCLHNYVSALHMTFSLSLVSVLGVVTGLLLLFRTNTAYARYWEGRCLVSKLVTQIRHLTRLIWAGVEESEDEAENLKIVIDKVSIINLLVAFAFSTKNYLREEYSYDHLEMRGVTDHLPRFRHFSTKDPQLSKLSNTIPARNNVSSNPSIKFESRPQKSTRRTKSFQKSKRHHSNKRPCDIQNGAPFNIGSESQPTNIPIEISYYIFAFVNKVAVKGSADGSTIYFLYDTLMTLVDCLTGFERILRSPIPLAYGVHLTQAVWLFLLALPYQLVANLNWWTIPAVTLASFAFLGIMRIGQEIENPFGYDHNDLPMDEFCSVIRGEVQMILGNPMVDLDSWILSKNNYPLAPQSWLSAEELIRTPISEIRTILAERSEYCSTIGEGGGKSETTATV